MVVSPHLVTLHLKDRWEGDFAVGQRNDDVVAAAVVDVVVVGWKLFQIHPEKNQNWTV